MTKYKGWIGGKEEDRQILNRLGITIVASSPRAMFHIEYQVIKVTEEMLSKLDPYWGQLVWGLESYEEE